MQKETQQLPPPIPVDWSAPAASDIVRSEPIEQVNLRLKNQEDARHFADGELLRDPLNRIPKTEEEKYAQWLSTVITLPQPVDNTATTTINPSTAEQALPTQERVPGRIRRLAGFVVSKVASRSKNVGHRLGPVV